MFEIGKPTKRSVEARILIAGLVLVVVLLLWDFYIDAVREIEMEWIRHMEEMAMEEVEGFAMVIAVPSIEEYFSSYGLKILIPHDILLAAYSAAVIIAVISIILLAKALMAIEDKALDHAKQLTYKGMKYFRSVLSLVMFFIIVNWMGESLFPFGTIFHENMWPIIAIAVAITITVRKFVDKAIEHVE